MRKKYSFDKILKEYNKKYRHRYMLPPKAFDVTIVHMIETNKFHVTYSDKSGVTKNKKSLHDFIHSHISAGITWKDIENIMLSKESDKLNLKIEIWPSSKIRYAYLYTNYFARDVGNLGKSCMRNKEMQKSLNFYIKNHARIVVVVDNNNKVHARALLWDNVKSTRNKKVFTYLDRVYTQSDVLRSLFCKLAEENKWEQYGSTSAGEAKSSLYKDNLDITGLCHLPYTDTFRYLYPKNNLVTSSCWSSGLKHKEEHLSLTTTGNGGYFPALDPDRVKEVLTGSHISKKDAVFVKRYKGYVLKKNIVDMNGAYYSTHDKDISQTKLDGCIFKKNVVNEVLTNDTMSKTAAIHSIDYDGYIHQSNVVNIKGTLYHKNDTDIICFEGKWYHISQCFVNYDREEYNKDLACQKIIDAWCIADRQHFPLPFSITITRKGGLIPKEHATIAYDLAYNGATGDIEYQEVYCTNRVGLIQLITGELIVSSAKNRKYLKKFNNRYYIKRTFELGDNTIVLKNTPATFQKPNKKQLLLFT